MPGTNKRFTLLKNPPTKRDGKEGEVTIREEKGELKLYVKYKNRWHGVKIGSAFDKLDNNVKKISKLPFALDKTRFGKKEFGSLWNAIDYMTGTKADSFTLHTSNTEAGVRLECNAGTLQLRNQADSADAAMHASTGTILTSI